jgi:hypothetical protein
MKKPRIYNTEGTAERWFAGYARLQRFKAIHGHTDVPLVWRADQPLSRWVRTQRERHLEGRLSPERIELLEKLAFRWTQLSHHEEAWKAQFTRLLAFKKRHGHARVPQNFKPDIKLGRWVNQQRIHKRRGTLSRARAIKLGKTGFMWDPLEAARFEFFDKLCHYRKIHGHPHVPNRWPKDVRLARWVETQRRRRKQGKLEGRRVKLLKGIGFHWIRQGAAKKG